MMSYLVRSLPDSSYTGAITVPPHHRTTRPLRMESRHITHILTVDPFLVFSV
jgi:hypothetical protein